MGFMSLAGPVALRQGPPRLAQLPGWNPGGSPAFIAQESTPVVVPPVTPAAAPAPVASPVYGGPSMAALGLGLGAFAIATILAFTCAGK